MAMRRNGGFCDMDVVGVRPAPVGAARENLLCTHARAASRCAVVIHRNAGMDQCGGTQRCFFLSYLVLGGVQRRRWTDGRRDDRILVVWGRASHGSSPLEYF